MSKSKFKLRAVTGTHDILEKDQLYFDKVNKIIKDIANSYNFSKIETPILEYSEIFEKSTGQDTDIVQKEMYSVKTSGEPISLRPEFTPGVVRSYLLNGMTNRPKPVKLYSVGPLFRKEKPQAGRYRQFNQFNFEIFGIADPVVDAHAIQMFYNILADLKIKNLCVDVNNIGCTDCRVAYKKVLVKYLKSKEKLLSKRSQKRIKTNPLRVIDSKDPKDIEVIKQCPQIVDYICDKCHTHLNKVLEYLDATQISYQLNPLLVRGLDYYTRTVFEIVQVDKEGNKSSALIGGGRYDNLITNMGGVETPAFGGAGGIERIILALKQKKELKPKTVSVDVFLAPLGESAKKKALQIFEELRKEKVKVGENFSKDSLKAQLGLADKFKSKLTLILGHREMLDGEIIVRNMKTGKQKTIKLEKLAKYVKKHI